MTRNVLFVLCLLFTGLTSPAEAREFQFGALKIEVVQSPARENGERDGSVKVRRADGTVVEKAFAKMAAGGGTSGFSVPKKQPRKDLFFVAKEGNYDDRLLAITPTGEILDLPFGETYADSRNLYSMRTREESGDAYAVLALKSRKIVQQGSSTIPPAIKAKVKGMKPVFPGLFYQAWEPVSN